MEWVGGKRPRLLSMTGCSGDLRRGGSRREEAAMATRHQRLFLPLVCRVDAPSTYGSGQVCVAPTIHRTSIPTAYGDTHPLPQVLPLPADGDIEPILSRVELDRNQEHATDGWPIGRPARDQQPVVAVSQGV